MKLYRTPIKVGYDWLTKKSEDEQMKYKEGDVVRVVRDEPGIPEETVGYVGEVKKVIDGVETKHYELSNGYWYGKEHLELVTGHDALMQKIVERNNKPDNVNHPPHYNQGKYETIDVIEDVTSGYKGHEGYLVGNVIKYLYRANFKGTKQEDLEKAKFYMDRLVDLEEKE